jgi:hypothetical protein
MGGVGLRSLRTVGYCGAAVEAVTCSGLGSRTVMSSGGGVEDRGVLKDRRLWRPCLGRPESSYDGRWVFGNFSKCWERARGA